MKELVINSSSTETRIALMEDKELVELTVERKENRSVVGNIYCGRVDSIIPGIQAAFVDIGLEKNGFLYVTDIARAEGTGDFEFVEGRAVKRQRNRSRKRPRVESILKKDQHIMVQVAKDTLGTKGVRLTNFITLPGRYVVLMPTVDGGGISRKVDDDDERERLKRILNSIRKKIKMGLITRTAAEGKSEKEIRDDVAYLNKTWTQIKNKMDRMKNSGLIHEDATPTLRVVRDIFTDDISKLTVDNEAEYSRIMNFLADFAPNLKKRCKLYRMKRPVFDRFGLEKEIVKALNRQVFLKSGGHICIDYTEALVAIDVNTGRFTGRKGLEETVFKTNIEAAKEIARQVRLRDIGGIIVIDFIDMEVARHRKELLRTLIESLKADRAKTTVSEINELGMIEMTRKRVKQNLLKTLSQTCPYCEGNGVVRSVTTMTLDILRRLESLFCTNREKEIILQVHPDVAKRLRNEAKKQVDDIAKSFKRQIQIESVSDFHIHDARVLNVATRKAIEL